MVRALEESLLSFYGSMQEKGIRPEIHMPETPVYRELDASALGRIFSNIISNALNKEAESPDKHWTFSFFSAGDERIELPPKVLETPIIPFDQSPTAVFQTTYFLYHISHRPVNVLFSTLSRKMLDRHFSSG